MISKIKNDLPASLVVFLVALPLCLGVALASGAPLLSGVISGVIGGIVVGFLSQSQVSVSGPAAGLAAVVLSAITQLGSFEVFLMAVVIAGALQLILGIARGGIVANYIPSNVIKGLLAAIGIILILKQLPHAVGYDANREEEFSFIQQDGQNIFSSLLNIFKFYSWGAILITITSILTMIYWDKTPLKRFKFFPASLFVVILGVSLNALFKLFIPQLAISSEHLVSMPEFTGLSDLIRLPNFSAITNYNVWIIGFTIAVIASIETLLNLEAVENIDPHKREASPNKELRAQGIGNMLSGLIGGLPITSVIVRSSVNINAGAETKLSAILHGLFLLVSILLLSPILNLIPLASLAAILLLTGYKLAKISLFKDMFKRGKDQFIPFMATILAIIFTDLLIGVIIGTLFAVFHILRSNFRNPFKLEKETLHDDETVRLILPTQVSILNKASIKDTLWSTPKGSRVIIDANKCEYICEDVMDIIDDFKNTVSVENNIKLNIIGLRSDYHLEDYIQFVNVLDKESQQKLAPEQVLDILKKGNERFVSQNIREKYLHHQVNATSLGQNPFAIVLSCIDSRTSTEHVFDLGIGDIFSIRIAGNVLNQDILGSMEYGVDAIGVKLIVVLGHTNCGAISGACNNVKLGNLTSLLAKVQPAIDKESTITTDRTGNNYVFVNKVAELNVYHTIERMRNESPLIADLEKAGKVRIVGGMYNLETGKVKFYE